MATQRLAIIPTAPRKPGPRSLRSMALKRALRNVTSIYDIGDLPFAVAKPILRQISNPDQLLHIERNCPQVTAEAQEMVEVWKHLMDKKFPKWEEKGYRIRPGLHGSDIFALVKKEEAKRIADAEATLARKMAGVADERKDHEAQFVSPKMAPKLPGGRRRGASSAVPRSKGAQTIFQKARREAVIAHKATAMVSAKGILPVAPGQLSKAPEAMLHEHRVAHNPSIRISAPRKRKRESTLRQAELVERDARVRAIKKLASPISTGQPAGMSTEEGGKKDDDFHDLFGDSPPTKRSRPTPVMSVSPSPGASRRKAIATPVSHSPSPSRPSVRPSSGLLSNAYRPRGSESPRTGSVRQSTMSPSQHSGSPMSTKSPLASTLFRSRARADIPAPKHPPPSPSPTRRAVRPPRSRSGSVSSQRSSRASTPTPSHDGTDMLTLPNHKASSPPDQLADPSPTIPQVSRPPKKKVDIFMNRKKRVH